MVEASNTADNPLILELRNRLGCRSSCLGTLRLALHQREHLEQRKRARCRKREHVKNSPLPRRFRSLRQYIFEARIDGLLLKQWLKKEWQRTGLPFRKANEACGVADAAVRKYFDQGHLWYYPPPDMFVQYKSTRTNTASRMVFPIIQSTANVPRQPPSGR
jgi:hypothetical protein